jgi:type IV secretory pathway VirB10-like protein
MRASTAFFAGAGTVIAAIVGGIGGGLLFADMISPKGPKQEMTRLEQRMSSQPIQVKADSEPAASPAAPPPPATAAAPVAPAPAVPAQAEAASTAPTAAPSAEAAAAARPAASATQSEPPRSQPAVQLKQAAAPEDSLARAKDADIKRAAVDKRKVDRRQQWTERRRNVQRRDQELLAFEEKVREETEIKPTFASEPARAEMPRIRLFDLD